MKRSTQLTSLASLCAVSFGLVSCGKSPTRTVAEDGHEGFSSDRVSATEFSSDVPSTGGTVSNGQSSITGWTDGSTEAPTGHPISTEQVPTEAVAGSTRPSEVAAPSSYDPAFCASASDGQCFTLILQIPSPRLETSLGLSALNLAQFSPNFGGILQRACQEGLEMSWKHVLADQGVGLVHRQGVMRRALGGVKRVRCVLQNITTENIKPLKLAQNETGFSVRLVDFAIESRSTSSAPAFGTFSFRDAKLSFKFRDPYAFVRTSDVGTGKRSWRPLAGYDALNVFRQTGIFPTAAKKIAFSQALGFDFNLMGSAAYVSHVMMPVVDSALRGQGLGKVGLQLGLIKKQLGVLAAGSNPVVPALILAAVGIDAVRDLCDFKASDCKIRSSSDDLTSVIASRYGNASILPSTTKATFVDATKYVPFAVLSALVEGMDKQAYLETMGVK